MSLGLTLSWWHQQEESEQEITAQQPVLIEIAYTKKDSQTGKKTSAAISHKESTPSRSSQKLAKGAASPALSSLLAKETKAGLNAEHFENFDEKYNSNNLGIKGSGAWVEQLEFQRGLELTGMLKHLHDTLNAHILYPEDFLKMRFKGSGRGTHSYYASRGFRISILRPQC